MPENPTTPRLLPKTGDDTRLGPFVAAMVLSGTGLVALGAWELRRRRREGGWDGDDPDDGYPHIRCGRVTQVMPDLGQGGGGDRVRKAILAALGVIALTTYACCRVAGETDRMEGLSR